MRQRGGQVVDGAGDDPLAEVLARGTERVQWRRLVDPQGRPRAFDVRTVPVADDTGRYRWIAEQYTEAPDGGTGDPEAAYGVELLAETPDFVLVLSPDGHILYRNAAAEGLARSVNEEAPNLTSLYPGGALRTLEEEALPWARERGRWHGECAIRDREGRTVPVFQSVIAHYDANGSVTHFFNLLRDLSERKGMERQLHHRASHDPLTGVHNRFKAEDFLDHALAWAQRYNRPLSALIADVDGFKGVNDRLGRSEGDRVLVELGEVLQGLTRRADLLARWAGEQFLIVAPDTDRAGALALGEKVRQAVAQAEFLEGERLTVSLGVAVLSEPEESGDALLSRADDALLQAKREGPGAIGEAPAPEKAPSGS